MIVMTTNAGSDHTAALAGFSASEQSAAEEKTQKALASFLRPEFLNRVDEIITFRSLDRADFVKIASIMLGELAAALAEKQITLTVTDAAKELVAEKSFSRTYGARNMRRYIQREIEDRLAAELISGYDRHYTQATVDADADGIRVSCL